MSSRRSRSTKSKGKSAKRPRTSKGIDNNDGDERHEKHHQKQTSSLLSKDRGNRLSTLFGSSNSQGTRSSQTPKITETNSDNYGGGDDDDGGDGDYREQLYSPPLDIRKKRKIATPVNQLHETPLGENSFDSDSSDDFLNLRNFKKNSHQLNANKKRPDIASTSSSTSRIDKLTSRPSSSQHSDSIKSKLKSPLTGTYGISTGSQGSGSRRLSGVVRGKRVSAIGNGFIGEPHSEIPQSSYHKFLDQSASEEDKMRQLLIWNLKAQLAKDENSRLGSTFNVESHASYDIGKAIKDELIQVLTEGSFSVGWKTLGSSFFDNENGGPALLPNPLNKSNLENIKFFSKSLQNLEQQLEDWETTYRASVAPIEKLTSISNTKDNVERPESLVDSTLVSNFKELEDSFTKTREDLVQVRPMVKKLYHAGYQMNQASELIKDVEKNKIHKQISRSLQVYGSSNLARNQEPSLLKKDKKATFSKTRNLLKSICQTKFQNSQVKG
ncbi:hypothetical protein KGF56_001897 [Candida oxycetoniae]|uniref:Uncharacterized protein n=1 Tax=Candida oxycetoniae TaxID=497107 RepID=A0AAI9SY70_9ASCO|nr:uncharacterized protein KGF56_001897 [Candida oxycetoniae]KAI3405300.2 hypothetical protein KGF56_001897 [Candida oxycetoniae]